MLKNKYIMVILGLTFLGSCQTDPLNPNPSQEPCKLKKVTYIDYSSGSGVMKEYALIYDGDKIVEMKSNEDKFIFSYDALGNLIKKELYMTGSSTPKIRVDYTFDSQSRLIKKKKQVFGGNQYQSFIEEYFYTNGEITEIKFYDYTTIAYEGKEMWTWSNGNPITRSAYDASGNLLFTANNIYHTNMENKLIQAHKNFFQMDYEDEYTEVPYGSCSFLGKNLLVKITYLSSQQIENYSYTFNNYGFISNFLLGEDGNPPLLFMKLAYSCD